MKKIALTVLFCTLLMPPSQAKDNGSNISAWTYLETQQVIAEAFGKLSQCKSPCGFKSRFKILTGNWIDHSPLPYFMETQLGKQPLNLSEKTLAQLKKERLVLRNEVQAMRKQVIGEKEVVLKAFYEKKLKRLLDRNKSKRLK